MNKLMKLAAATAFGLSLATPGVAQDAGPLSGLSTLNGLTPLIAAGSDPAILPALGENVATGVVSIAMDSIYDPTGMTSLSPLDIASLPDIMTGTVMLQNYPGGVAVLPVLDIVGPVLGGVLGD